MVGCTPKIQIAILVPLVCKNYKKCNKSVCEREHMQKFEKNQNRFLYLKVINKKNIKILLSYIYLVFNILIIARGNSLSCLSFSESFVYQLIYLFCSPYSKTIQPPLVYAIVGGFYPASRSNMLQHLQLNLVSHFERDFDPNKRQTKLRCRLVLIRMFGFLSADSMVTMYSVSKIR